MHKQKRIICTQTLEVLAWGTDGSNRICLSSKETVDCGRPYLLTTRVFLYTSFVFYENILLSLHTLCFLHLVFLHVHFRGYCYCSHIYRAFRNSFHEQSTDTRNQTSWALNAQTRSSLLVEACWVHLRALLTGRNWWLSDIVNISLTETGSYGRRVVNPWHWTPRHHCLIRSCFPY
jgi:hypothetical protein